MNKIFFIFLFLIPINISSTVISDIRTANKYLDKLHNEIKQEESELKNIKNTREDLLGRIEHIEKKISFAESVLKELNVRIEKLNKNKNSLEKEIVENEQQLQNLKNQLNKTNTYIVDNKGYTQLKVLIFSKTYHDTIKNMEILDRINNKIINKINQLKQIVEKIEKLKKDYSNAARNLNEIYTAKQKVTKELSNEKLKYEQTLALLKEDEKNKKEYIKILNNKYNMLSNKIKELEKQKSGDPNEFSTSFEKYRGKIPWPAKGKVVEEFGPKKIDGFNGEIFNKGIKIALNNENISAVFDGKVKYVDWVRGYGNIVIIQHDKYYYTLYANLDKVFVNIGQDVLQKEQIGQINITTGKNNSTLYFEIRKQNEAVNPLLWLQ